MNKRRLGRNGFEVSEVGLGCWQLGADWGRSFSTEEGLAILHEAVGTIIPGASSPRQVASNAAVAALPPLSDELHAKLAEFYQDRVRDQIRGAY